MKTDGTNARTAANNGSSKQATLKQGVAKMPDHIAMSLPSNITPEVP